MAKLAAPLGSQIQAELIYYILHVDSIYTLWHVFALLKK